MTFQEFAATLEYQPVDTFPWVEDTDWDEDSPRRWNAPQGVVVRYQWDSGVSYDLFGYGRPGPRSNGCDCCSRDYMKELPSKATGWAWVHPALGN